MTVKIFTGDCREVLRTLPDESVHCVVTSPPYWGLRDYGIVGQLGMERSLGEYIETIISVFAEVKRVLRSDGTLWLNLGDSYAANMNGRSAAETKALGRDDRTFRDKPFSTIGPIIVDKIDNSRPGKSGNFNNLGSAIGSRIAAAGNLKPKDLCGIPWRVALALQNDGWWLRQDIIWSKPNPMPESVTDRCTKAHEYIFLLSKSAKYYYDAEAIAEPITESSIERLSQPTLAQQEGYWRVPGKTNGPMKARGPRFGTPGGKAEIEYGSMVSGEIYVANGKRNKRSVWTVTTQPYSEAHFATFPPALIEPCILAGTSEKGCCAKCGMPMDRIIEATALDGRKAILGQLGPDGKALIGDNMIDAGVRGSFNAKKGVLAKETIGWSLSCQCNAETTPCTVLDPFGGAGTTGLVADRLGRNAILIELNPGYAAMAEKRIRSDAGMFADVHGAVA